MDAMLLECVPAILSFIAGDVKSSFYVASVSRDWHQVASGSLLERRCMRESLMLKLKQSLCSLDAMVPGRGRGKTKGVQLDWGCVGPPDYKCNCLEQLVFNPAVLSIVHRLEVVGMEERDDSLVMEFDDHPEYFGKGYLGGAPAPHAVLDLVEYLDGRCLSKVMGKGMGKSMGKSMIKGMGWEGMRLAEFIQAHFHDRGEELIGALLERFLVEMINRRRVYLGKGKYKSMGKGMDGASPGASRSSSRLTSLNVARS